MKPKSAPKRLLARLKKPAVELYHCDCVEGMKRLSAGSVDVVVTSPPYNLGIKYRSYKDNQQRDAYLAWSMEWAAEIRRVLKPAGSFFLNIAGAPSNPLLPFELTGAFTEKLFVLQNTIHWVKAISMEMDDGEIMSRGHFKPINSHRYLNDCHEHVFHFTKEGNVAIDRLAIGVPYTDKSNISRWSHTGGGDLRCGGNTWFIPYKTIRSRDRERPHPATFPPDLAERCIRLHGNVKSSVVLDPFAGIGSAAIAAGNCGVARFIGFDIDAGYLKVAAAKMGAKIHESPPEPAKKSA